MSFQNRAERRGARIANSKPTYRCTSAQVVFVIGLQRIKYYIYKDFICYYSSVFRAAFTGNCVEGRTQTYTISDIEQTVFELFIQWMFEQGSPDERNLSIHSPELKKSPQVEDAPQSKREEYVKNVELLQQLWLFGDRYRIDGLQNTCLKRQEDLQSKYGLIMFPLAHSRTENNFDDFIIDMCAYYCHNGVSWRESLLRTVSKETMIRVLAAMGSVKKRPEAKDYYVTLRGN